MITKEMEDTEKCCIYVNDFHLEMILLPYIKRNLYLTKFIIITENNMEESIKTLLERTNLSIEDKEKIYNLNWNNNFKDKIDYIRNYKKHNENFAVIVKGNLNFMVNILKEINVTKNENINIIKCYKIDELDIGKVNFDKSSILKTGKI